MVKGHVQGVGFRMYTRLCALKLKLRGWVKNEPDGSVCGIVSGEGENIELFFNQLRKGNSLAMVSHIEINSQHWQDFEDFEIKY